MTYLIPTIYKTILLVFCAGLLIQTLSRLGVLNDLLKSLSQADVELMACAQRNANFQNIKSSYEYLSKKFPQFEEDFRSAKEKFSPMISEEAVCTHPIFRQIHSSSHEQVNKGYPQFWPNRVLAMKETHL